MSIISRIVWSILSSLMLLSGLQAFRNCNVPRLNTNLMNVMRLHKSRRGMPLMFFNNFPKAFARSQHFLFSSETDKTQVGHKETSSTVKDGFKTLWKKYGYVAIGTYLSIYVVTLSSIFLSLDFDLFNAGTFGFDPNAAVFKVCDLFETVTGSKALPAYIKENPRVGTFAIAWVMTKFTEPIRFGVTLAIVPKISRMLKMTGTEGKSE